MNERSLSESELSDKLACLQKLNQELALQHALIGRKLRQSELELGDLINERERRKAVGLVIDPIPVSWGHLLQNNFSDSFKSASTLKNALKQYDISPLDGPGEFYRDSGQQVLCIKLDRSDENQVARIQTGLVELYPFLECGRGYRCVRIIRPSLKRGQRLFLEFRPDERAAITGTFVSENVFQSLNEALLYAREHLYFS